jgi:hypothetical protein
MIAMIKLFILLWAHLVAINAVVGRELVSTCYMITTGIAVLNFTNKRSNSRKRTGRIPSFVILSYCCTPSWILLAHLSIKYAFHKLMLFRVAYSKNRRLCQYRQCRGKTPHIR